MEVFSRETCQLSYLYIKRVMSPLQSCNYHKCSLRHIRPLINKDTAIILVCSIVSFRLDYCNAVLYETTSKNADRFQRVQNSLGRVVCNVPCCSLSQPLRTKNSVQDCSDDLQCSTSSATTVFTETHRLPACSISAVFNQCFINRPIDNNCNSCSRFSCISPTNLQ